MLTPNVLSGKRGIISVWLDNTDDGTLKQFRCTVCGKVVFEYYNDQKLIMAGENEGAPRKMPIVIQCHGVITVYKNEQEITTRCKTRYIIS